MIDFQFEKDKRRFLKRNDAVSKKVEYQAEEQRLRLGLVDKIRRPLIEKVYARPILFK